MEVTKFLKSEGHEPLIAFFNIKYKAKIQAYGSLIVVDQYVNNMKLFQKNGKKWISFPDRRYEKDGQIHYIPYLGFIEKNDDFSAAVLKAIDDFCRNGAHHPFRELKMKSESRSEDECPF